MPTKYPQWGNLGRNHWEIPGEDIRYGSIECTKDALKKFQDTKNKEDMNTQKQINELRKTSKKTPKWNKGHQKKRYMN
jgi:hypothetical protein